ncbi:MAG TPA: cellulase family glycosylhydrolase [Acidimicrobiia bacterium]|nr:cellulase family glycosylhydrolase [Acidimicrobiia bacterium]
MRLRVTWAVALALAVSVVVGVVVVVVGRSDPAPSTPVPKAEPRSVAGLTCAGPPPARTPAGDRAGFSEGAVLGGRQGPNLEAELAGIAATGARYLRVDVDWSAIEQARGVHDWSAVDEIVDTARACGLDVIGLLAYTPGWARGPGTTEHSPPTDPANFASFARAAAERYAPRGVKAWEIWNEPNLTFYWMPSPDPAAYAALLGPAYDAIKAVDPSSTVITGGLAPAENQPRDQAMKPLPFLEGVYAAGGGGKFDAVGYHPYTYPALPTGDSGSGPFVITTPKLHGVMAKHGDKQKQVWGTEMGAPTTLTTLPTFQAQYLTRAYSRWDRWSFTGPLIWYSYLDAGTNPTAVEDNLGLVRADFVTKEPSFAAFEKAMRRR